MNSPRKILKEEVRGIRFTVDGLKPQTLYNYSLLVRDTERNILNTYSGTFRTSNIETREENIKVDNLSNQKLLRDGQIFILRGDKTYTIDGRLVR